ncbi:MAG: hypothetical protein SGILL_000901 [Bacillariaceae sp.]
MVEAVGFVVDVVIGCGLSIHFSDIPYEESMNPFGLLLDSSCAVSMKFLNLSRNVSKTQVAGLDALQPKTHNCVERYGIYEHHQSITWSHWRKCESLAMILTLPPEFKGAIMLSLTASATRKVAALKLLQVLEDGLSNIKGATHRICGYSTLLRSLPLLLASIQSDHESSAQKREILARIRNVMISTAKSNIMENEVGLQQFLSTFRGIQEVLQDETKVEIRDPRSVLTLLLVRHRETCGFGGNLDGQPMSNLHDVILHLPSKLFNHMADPSVRYLLASVLTEYVLSHDILTLRHKMLKDGNGLLSKTGLSWILSVPFVDRCRQVRNLTFQGVAAMISNKNTCFAIARYCSDDSFRIYCTETEKNEERSQDLSRLKPIAEDAAFELFQEIDGLLKQCGFTDPQLSLTLGEVSAAGFSGRIEVEHEWMAKQRPAVGLLAAMGRSAGLGDPVGFAVCDKSLLRLARVWAAPSAAESASSFSNPASLPCYKNLAFGPVAFLPNEKQAVSSVTATISWAKFGTNLCTDVVLLNTQRPIHDAFSALVALVHLLAISGEDTLLNTKALSISLQILERELPSIAAQFLIAEDTVGLNIAVGCHHLAEEKLKSISSACSRRGRLVGESTMGRTFAFSYICADDESKSKSFCLEKMDQILPLLLLSSQPSSLKFLTRLSGLSLGRIIKSREQMTLKRLVWELGGHDYDFHNTVNALKSAALARSDTNTMASGSQDLQLAATAAKNWITENFMYLFVNTVQMNWNVRSDQEQMQALRCLTVLFDFLHAEKASQYFPQVLGALSQAVNDGLSSDAGSDSLHLGLEAVKSLSKFVRLAAKRGLDVVIDNLTEIVVLLIPILENPLLKETRSSGSTLLQSQDEAVLLLEFLTHKDIVRRFPRSFSEIPFLPSSEALANVHRSLRANGIIFDNLCILSTSATDSQSGGADHDSLTDSIKPSTKDGEKILALRKRLEVISSLLENENVGVKSVVLNHLIVLLRSNRKLFHELVRSEGSASLRDFLTVLVADGKEHGVITDIVEKLIRRCGSESNSRVRVQLATCLGEVGAIAESSLEDMTLYRSNADVSVSMHRWRLDTPPWQTSAQKYELLIVTKYLVLALKASSTSEEQLKIAYAIQQLLNLLDASSPDTEATSVNTGETRKMSPWLYDQLHKANVYETIEPFWSSHFNEKVRHVLNLLIHRKLFLRPHCRLF